MRNLSLVFFLYLVFNQVHCFTSIQKFQKAIFESFNTLSTTEAPRSILQCCIACKTSNLCEGVKFDGSTCSLLNKVKQNNDNSDTAIGSDTTEVDTWINAEINGIESKRTEYN